MHKNHHSRSGPPPIGLLKGKPRLDNDGDLIERDRNFYAVLTHKKGVYSNWDDASKAGIARVGATWRIKAFPTYEEAFAYLAGYIKFTDRAHFPSVQAAINAYSQSMYQPPEAYFEVPDIPPKNALIRMPSPEDVKWTPGGGNMDNKSTKTPHRARTPYSTTPSAFYTSPSPFSCPSSPDAARFDAGSLDSINFNQLDIRDSVDYAQTPSVPKTQNYQGKAVVEPKASNAPGPKPGRHTRDKDGKPVVDLIGLHPDDALGYALSPSNPLAQYYSRLRETPNAPKTGGRLVFSPARSTTPPNTDNDSSPNAGASQLCSTWPPCKYFTNVPTILNMRQEEFLEIYVGLSRDEIASFGRRIMKVMDPDRNEILQRFQPQMEGFGMNVSQYTWFLDWVFGASYYNGHDDNED